MFTIFIFDAEKEGERVLRAVLHAAPLELKRSQASWSVMMFGKGCKYAQYHAAL